MLRSYKPKAIVPFLCHCCISHCCSLSISVLFKEMSEWIGKDMVVQKKKVEIFLFMYY